MTKPLFKSLGLLVAATFLWCGAAFGADWTFMVYLDADNNLEAAGIDDFSEMATVGSDANVNIVVQFDRIDGYDTTNGDWTTCKRFLVGSGMIPTEANQVDDIGECNMADPDTLQAFIDWGVSTYPADQYAVILWNHGGGWRLQRAALMEALELATSDAETESVLNALAESDAATYKAVCWDDTSNDALYMKEVQSALNAASDDMDLIGFDACLMGMIEVAYELKDVGASVMVASEETEAFDGWPYDTILADLTTNPTWGPDALGSAIVYDYDASYTNDYTLSAVDLTTIGSLGDTVSSLADAMQTDWDGNKVNVQDAAQAVMDGVDTAVIEEGHGSSLPGSYGLAIYFPSTSGDFDSDYKATVIDFAADTLWDEFLSDFHDDMGGSWIDTARSSSQEYDYPEHIDLYDFCNEIVSADVQETPVADAGSNRTVTEGEAVTLDGSDSTFPDSATPGYLWEQTAGPSVSLSDETSVMPVFTAPEVDADGESLTFRLTVSDGGGQEDSDTCTVTVVNDNEGPVADSGGDQAVDEGDTVTLDGTGSTDPDDGIASYLWEQTEGTLVALSDETAVQPTFKAPDVDESGEALIFRLTVTDAGGLQATDTSTVDVSSVSDASTRSSSGGGGGCFINSLF
jgi:hypothetical protein